MDNRLILNLPKLSSAPFRYGQTRVISLGQINLTAHYENKWNEIFFVNWNCPFTFDDRTKCRRRHCRIRHFAVFIFWFSPAVTVTISDNLFRSDDEHYRDSLFFLLFLLPPINVHAITCSTTISPLTRSFVSCALRNCRIRKSKKKKKNGTSDKTYYIQMFDCEFPNYNIIERFMHSLCVVEWCFRHAATAHVNHHSVVDERPIDYCMCRAVCNHSLHSFIRITYTSIPSATSPYGTSQCNAIINLPQSPAAENRK